MNKLIIGDNRQVMRQLINDGVKVQTCITSPPYFGLRDYGHSGQIGLEPTLDDYINNLVDVFAHVRELLADDGTLWLNIGDSYSGSGKGRDGNQEFNQNSLHGKQATSQGSIAGRIPKQSSGLPPKNLIGVPWRLALALQADGWWLRQEIIWHKPNAMPGSYKDRFTSAHESIFLLTKNPDYYFNQEAVKEPSVCQSSERTSRDDFKREDSKRGKTIPHQRAASHRHNRPVSSYDVQMRNKRNVWTVPTRADNTAHFATYPPELIEPCVLAGSRIGDIVFDPFFGSGTTAEVANKFSRQWLGVELNPEYQNLYKIKVEQQALTFHSEGC